jgi:hypothetical protein
MAREDAQEMQWNPALLESPADREPQVDTALRLRILGGLHRNAERLLTEGDMVMIGAAHDCDVILADVGVAPHHCILSLQNGTLSLRAVDAEARISGRTLRPGDPRAVPHLAAVSVGGAMFAVGRGGAAHWPQAEAPAAPTGGLNDAAKPDIRPPPPPSQQRSRHLRSVVLGGVLLAIVSASIAVAGYGFRHGAGPELAAGERGLNELIEQLGLKEVAVRADQAGHIIVQGIVPSASSQSELRQAISAHRIPATVAVRSGDDIASDVREILRLSEIVSESRYLGAGRVEVRGHFGDGRLLQSVIGSRAMREIDGLKQVAVLNLDGARLTSEAPLPAADAKRITAVVSGRDPYAVTADGSRYYLGARLPAGAPLAGRLIAIEGNELIVDTGEHVERFKAPGARVSG